VIKVILAVLILFCCGSIGYTVDFDQGDTWVSNRYTGTVPDTEYRQGDRTIKAKNLGFFGREYVFQRSGRNLYKAYNDETGNFLEMKIRRNGSWEFYDYEDGESWLVTKPAGRE
jgi:hypothetical protein